MAFQNGNWSRTHISTALVMACCIAWGITANNAAGGTPEWMLRAQIKGQYVEGKAVFWSQREVQLLCRDGRLLTFHPSDANNFSRLSTQFVSYPAAKIRAELIKELGEKFDVTGTGHYIVACPRGEKNHWAERFEDLYRTFVHYFRLRGFSVQEPQFPLVAVVWPTQEEFMQYARQEGSSINRNVLGYYSPRSNRVTLYDVTRGNPDSANWHHNAETIIHEATHQTAYNTNIHVRFGETPTWVVEGLATMFEAPGIWNFRFNKDLKDRINRGRLEGFRNYLGRSRKADSLADLVGSDRRFRSNPDAAYAEAWALSFFLSETRPAKYGQYLKLTTQRAETGNYTSDLRIADFTKVFGANMKKIELEFLDFMKTLK
jgi:hypothetical protein